VADTRYLVKQYNTYSVVVEIPKHLRAKAGMRRVPYDRVIGEDNHGQRARIAARVDSTLQDAQAVMERWTYYARKGTEHSLNSSELLVPHSIPGAVVLDATASQNFLWELFQDRAAIVPVCTGARNYSTATLHVARADGVGKHSMRKNFSPRYAR
jgi:hypothetical protein